MQPLYNVVAAGALVLLGPAAAASAAMGDQAGCKDPVGLKRFQGSALALCETRDFAEYEVPQGKLSSWDYGAKRATFASKMDVAGRTSFNLYVAPTGPSAEEVAHNYRLDLEEKGYSVLFAAKGQELGFDQGRYFESFGPGGQLVGYSAERSRYVAAVKDEGERRIYVSLYVVEYQGGVHPKIAPKPNQVLVRLDTVEAGALKHRMQQVVSSSELERNIDTQGRVTLQGIYFDFNKSELKPESKPALDEIAAFMRKHPARRLHVVGHTDAVGAFDFNLRLSQSRAAAVADALLRGYGIAQGRLTPNGVGMLAPIATNTTEDGRAKNRRVELVPH